MVSLFEEGAWTEGVGVRYVDLRLARLRGDWRSLHNVELHDLYC